LSRSQRERVLPPAPLGADGPYLEAILHVLDEIADTLAEVRDRLPATDNGGEPARVAEPAPQSTPDGQPRKVAEPAPAGPPERDDEDDQPVPVDEPAPDTAPQPEPDRRPEPPPRAGRGSSLDAWRTFADAAQVAWTDDMKRDDIVAACEQAGAIEPQEA